MERRLAIIEEAKRRAREKTKNARKQRAERIAAEEERIRKLKSLENREKKAAANKLKANTATQKRLEKSLAAEHAKKQKANMQLQKLRAIEEEKQRKLEEKLVIAEEKRRQKSLEKREKNAAVKLAKKHKANAANARRREKLIVAELVMKQKANMQLKKFRALEEEKQRKLEEKLAIAEEKMRQKSFEKREKQAAANLARKQKDQKMREKVLAAEEDRRKRNLAAKAVKEQKLLNMERRKADKNEEKKKLREEKKAAAILAKKMKENAERNAQLRALREEEQAASRGDDALTASFPAKAPSQVPQWMARVIKNQGDAPTPQTLLGPVASAEDEAKACEASRGAAAQKPIFRHQAVVKAMCALKANGVLKTPGLLALHSTGAGKTLAGLCALLSFWNFDRWAIFPISVRSNQKGNDLDTLGALACRHFPNFANILEGIAHRPFSSDPAEAAKAIATRLRMSHGLLGGSQVPASHLLGSFATLAHDFYGDNGYARDWDRDIKCVFIVDEIQMLLDPPASEKKLTQEYEHVKKMLMTRKPHQSFVLGLTATPGGTPEQVTGVMKCILADASISTAQSIASKAQNCISKAYLLGDPARFASVDVSQECSLDVTGANGPEHGFYATLYFAALEKLEETHEAVIKAQLAQPRYNARGEILPPTSKLPPAKKYAEAGLPNPYATLVERAGNLYLRRVKERTEYLVLTQQSSQRLEDDDSSSNEDSVEQKNSEAADQAMFQTLQRLARKGSGPVLELINGRGQGGQGATARTAAGVEDGKKMVMVLSPKIVGALKAILATPGQVHYVYTQFPSTLIAITHLLQRYGYQRWRKGGGGDGLKFGFINDMAPRSTKIYDHVTGKYAAFDGVKPAEVKALMTQLQRRGNERGHVCQVILATRESYKGVDIRAVRHVHQLTALPNFIDVLQLVGRGPRSCGHYGLPGPQRVVKFRRWELACEGTGASSVVFPDVFVHHQGAEAFAKGYGAYESALMSCSADRLLFDQFNREEKDLQKKLMKGSSDVHPPPIIPPTVKPAKKKQLPKKNAQPAGGIYLNNLFNGNLQFTKAGKPVIVPLQKMPKTPRKLTPGKKRDVLRKRLAAYERRLKRGEEGAWENVANLRRRIK